MGHHEHEVDLVPVDQVAQVDRDRLFDALGWESVEEVGPQSARQGNLETWMQGGEFGQSADLLREDRRELVRPLDVVEVAAASLGHARQQHLVEADSHSHRGSRDAACPQLGGVSRQRVDVGDALVRLAIGEEDRPLKAVLVARHCRRQLLAAGQPTVAERGPAASIHLIEIRPDPGAGRWVSRSQRLEHVDLVVERDDGYLVVRDEVTERGVGRLFRKVNLVATHRAGSIEHERNVDRGAVALDGCRAMSANGQAKGGGVPRFIEGCSLPGCFDRDDGR